MSLMAARQVCPLFLSLWQKSPKADLVLVSNDVQGLHATPGMGTARHSAALNPLCGVCGGRGQKSVISMYQSQSYSLRRSHPLRVGKGGGHQYATPGNSNRLSRHTCVAECSIFQEGATLSDVPTQSSCSMAATLQQQCRCAWTCQGIMCTVLWNQHKIVQSQLRCSSHHLP